LLQAREANYNQVWIYAELKDLGELVAHPARPIFPHYKVFFWEDGTGAVLPFLIQQYGVGHTIIAVQRLSSNWERVPEGMLSIGTNVGDTMPFQTQLLDSIANEPRIFLLVPGIALCHEQLSVIRQKASDLVVSCSLGDGQNELIRMLKMSESWSKVLIFENTAHDNWSGLKRCYQIVVDRICWHVDPYTPNGGIISHCERSKYVRFYWPKSSGIPEKAQTGSRPPGEKIDLPPCSLNPIPDADFERQHSRKRALINAPHAIAAVLSHHVLAYRRMSPGNQYLAPLQLMLEAEHPQWYQAMDNYLRLRAIEVAWSRFSGERDQEQLHKEYLDAYATAKEAGTRFFETNDRLDRLCPSSEILRQEAA
jgi:hypothetical protein